MMVQVFLKEVRGFLNSLIAYLAVGVFLTIVGLTVWVFPETSVIDHGYASLDPLFFAGPYVFLFLIPAITMRTFAEERKLGTLELLLTKPIADWHLIVGKFLASFGLVLFALLPTLVYYYFIYWLGSPPGNVDSSAVAGSYIGLLLLAATFCAIGIFSSSLTSNQIVAFMISAFVSFIFYAGLDSFSTVSFFSGISLFIKKLGILYHYESVSRGLIDSRDLLYFLGLSLAFLLLTRTILSKRSW